MSGTGAKIARKMAVSVVATTIGFAVAGPLGAVLGPVMGHLFTGWLSELPDLLPDESLHKILDKALEIGAEGIDERLKKRMCLQAVYQDALRLSLREMKDKALEEDRDWFVIGRLALAQRGR